jgi:hypothetical protein
MKTYKLIAMTVFTAVAFSFPVIGVYNILSAVLNGGAPDASAVAVSYEVYYSIGFWIVNIISMICVQIVFNKFLLKKIVLRNKIESE